MISLYNPQKGRFFRVKVALTYSLHCSSFLGLPYRILSLELVKPQKGATVETVGSHLESLDPLKCENSRTYLQELLTPSNHRF